MPNIRQKLFMKLGEKHGVWEEEEFRYSEKKSWGLIAYVGCRCRRCTGNIRLISYLALSHPLSWVVVGSRQSQWQRPLKNERIQLMNFKWNMFNTFMNVKRLVFFAGKFIVCFTTVDAGRHDVGKIVKRRTSAATFDPELRVCRFLSQPTSMSWFLRDFSKLFSESLYREIRLSGSPAGRVVKQDQHRIELYSERVLKVARTVKANFR